jgi:hypothetical protein
MNQRRGNEQTLLMIIVVDATVRVLANRFWHANWFLDSFNKGNGLWLLLLDEFHLGNWF